MNSDESIVSISNAVQTIKTAILRSQQRALAGVNQEQLMLYYAIGRYISINTRNKNWGKGVIEGISNQLLKEMPGLRGFSAQNLRKMRAFYEEWSILADNSLIETSKISDGSNSLIGMSEISNKSNSSVGTNELYPIVISSVGTNKIGNESKLKKLL